MNITWILVTVLGASGCLALAGLIGVVSHLVHADVEDMSEVFIKDFEREEQQPLSRKQKLSRAKRHSLPRRTAHPVKRNSETVPSGAPHAMKESSQSLPRSQGQARPIRKLQIGDHLAMIGGVDQELLAQVPWERRRFIQISGMLLTAAGVAALSMFFALHDYVRILLLPSVIISLIWALIVLNVERFLILSIRSGYTIRQFSLAITPRVLVAVLLGLAVSIPITLRIFEPDIEKYIKAAGPSHVDAGLLGQLQALSKLTAQSTTANVAEWAVFVFFLLLQVAPILAQLVVNQLPTAYAKIAENRDSILIDRAQLLRAEGRRVAEQESNARIDIAEDMRRRELEIGKRANEQVASAIEEILDRALNDWRRKVEAALAGSGQPERGLDAPAIDAPTIQSFAIEGAKLVEAIRAGELANLN